MVKITTSILIDFKVKEESKKILHKKGIAMSSFIEGCLKDLINDERRVKDNGIFKEERVQENNTY
ncbi:MAG TPA: hypothetical protein VJ438_01490 [Candidatus Nanoarchaeia archaeon]|nr:hypothetical protein [Candidatus Nanoarchaeia archaeon]